MIRWFRRNMPHEHVPVWAQRSDVPLYFGGGKHGTLCCQICHKGLRRGEYKEQDEYPWDDSFVENDSKWILSPRGQAHMKEMQSHIDALKKEDHGTDV